MGSRNVEAHLHLPPRFKFFPIEEVLVVHYLCKKATSQSLPIQIIANVDLYKYDPSQLLEKALFGEKEWYFFTLGDRKYPNGSRPNKVAGFGYWKFTGVDKPITSKGGKKRVGIKKALVFYVGKAPKGSKTNWLMHEYYLANLNRNARKKGSSRVIYFGFRMSCTARQSEIYLSDTRQGINIKNGSSKSKDQDS